MEYYNQSQENYYAYVSSRYGSDFIIPDVYNGGLTRYERIKLVVDQIMVDVNNGDGPDSNEKLKNIIDGENLYSRIIATRLLFEREEGLLSKLKKVAPGVCKFINESNHIENDYVIQLNPRKHFSIPDCFLKDLKDFIQENFT